MVYRRRRIVLSEIDRQCSIALMSYDDAAAGVQRRSACRFWSAIQGLLTAAAHLNRLLWPLLSASVGWAAALRATLGLQDDSPLHHPDLAAILDIDVLLESWQASHPNRTWQPSNFEGQGFTPARSEECLRYFDRETSIFIFGGHVFDLPGMLAAIAELGHRVRLEMEHMRELV